jgi:hypothetical protein
MVVFVAIGNVMQTCSISGHVTVSIATGAAEVDDISSTSHSPSEARTMSS